jgi:hypothetical protein
VTREGPSAGHAQPGPDRQASGARFKGAGTTGHHEVMRSLPILLSIAALAVSFVPARPAVADGLAAAEEASLAPPKMEAVGAPVAPGGPDPAALSQPPSPLPQVAPLVLQSPEKANAYFQGTWMEGRHGAFSAAYTNLNGSPNSLLPSPETSWTTSATGFFGLRLWQGGEVYVAPEVIAETPFSGLHGLGGDSEQ